jgi:hypothetical protein
MMTKSLQLISIITRSEKSNGDGGVGTGEWRCCKRCFAVAMPPAEVDAIAGGEYWRAIISDSRLSFDEKEEAITNAYLQQMRRHSPMVCSFPIRKRYGLLPKYRLIYGTRHADGILLMNDAMYKARERSLKQEFAVGKLFDLRPPEETKNLPSFTNGLFNIVKENEPISRKALKLKGVQEFFCHYSRSDYSNAIRSLLDGSRPEKLYSASGRTRINESELLSSKPFK